MPIVVIGIGILFIIGIIAAVVTFAMMTRTDADIASNNLSKAADQFEIDRRIVSSTASPTPTFWLSKADARSRWTTRTPSPK